MSAQSSPQWLVLALSAVLAGLTGFATGSATKSAPALPIEALKIEEPSANYEVDCLGTAEAQQLYTALQHIQLRLDGLAQRPLQINACPKCVTAELPIKPPPRQQADSIAEPPNEVQTGVQPEPPTPKTAQSSKQRCAAKTTKGTQCRRKARSNSPYCWQHQP